MKRASIVASVIFCSAFVSASEEMREPRVFFREQIGLTEVQIASIARGKAVVKVLSSKTPSEIIVFGAVFVNANPAEYVQFALDVRRLRRLPGYMGVGRFSEPPTLSDLGGFALEPDDIRSLKACRPGKCGVQLPSESMRELQNAMDWYGPELATQVNDRVRKMALEVVQRYRDRGNSALGSYYDTERPFDVDAQLMSLLGRSVALPAYLPELNRYLLDYPATPLTSIETVFYWERVKFGLKPTLRLNHAIAYRSIGPKGVAQVVMVKQLYASHYFQLALDLTACVTESGHTGDKGFYLVSLKGSTQQGLTGFKGAILRRLVVSRTRAAQENVLIGIKRALEQKP